MKHLVVLSAIATALCLNVRGNTYNVPAVDHNDPLGVFTDPLQVGRTYLFEASGTYKYWLPNKVWADAEFTENYSGTTERYPTFSEDILDLIIDGIAVDWLGNSGSGWTPHTLSPNHVYRYYVIGNGSPVNLAIADWRPLLDQDYTGDNEGSLQVAVTGVPDAGSAVALLGGAFTILGVLGRKFRM